MVSDLMFANIFYHEKGMDLKPPKRFRKRACCCAYLVVNNLNVLSVCALMQGLNVALQGLSVERLKGEVHHQLNTPAKPTKDVVEDALLKVRVCYRHGVRKAPVGANRLAGPHGAYLTCSFVADGDDKIQLRCIDRSKLVPVLRAKARGVHTQTCHLLKCHWMHITQWLTACRVGNESSLTYLAANCLSHD